MTVAASMVGPHRRAVVLPLGFLILTALAGAGACDQGSSGGGPGPLVTMTDSAGVELMYSSAPAAGERTVGAEPMLEIRSDSSDPTSLLFQVVEVEVLPDGGVALANRGDNTVRLHASNGRPVWRVGGDGGGPGEFTDLRGIALVDDGLVAWQPLPRAAHVFDLEGRWLRSAPMPAGLGPNVRGILANGAAVATLRTGSSPLVAGLQEVALVRAEAGGSDTLAVLPTFRTVIIPELGVAEAQALGPVLHVAAGDSLIYASFSEAWDIGVWGPGGLHRRIRRAWDPVPVDPGHRNAYRETLAAAGGDDPQVRQSYRVLADGMTFPDHHPAHARLLAGADGMLWVERPQTEPPWSEGIDYSPVPPHPGIWDVFGGDGVWLTTVHLPARFRLMWAGEDRVAGVALDDLDVESVQVWRLEAR